METTLVYNEDNPSKWNNMEIIYRGVSIKTRVNGNLVSDFNGKGILNDEVHRSWQSGEIGCIAFQLHMNDELKIRFKDIFIKELAQ